MVSGELNMCFEVLEKLLKHCDVSISQTSVKIMLSFLFVLSVFYCGPFTVQTYIYIYVAPRNNNHKKMNIMLIERRVSGEWRRTIWNGNSCAENK